MDDLQATLGDGYTLERELGGGGMSRVFVAREHALGRDVVVKVLRVELTGGVSAERFAREIKLAASLQEPHIVPVLTAGVTSDALPYYTMPYIRGESLRARMRSGPVPLAEAVGILRNVAEALAYAHAQGVIHRDIKPENVLLSSRTAVVTDFGIAKALQQARTAAANEGRQTETLTQLGTAIGTPAYMAPEQAAGDPSTDHRADLYSWGVVAYELLSGRHPFATRTTPQALMAAHFSETPAPLPKTTPRALATVVMRCLAKDPAARPASANDLIAGLDAVPMTSGARVVRGRTLLVAGAIAAVVTLAAVLVARRPAAIGTAPSSDMNRSVVVLPLDNASGDTASAYFADGLTDELTSAVAKVSALRVIGGTSAAIAKGQGPVDEHVIGEKLHVAQVLEGSVRRAGSRVRIIARLTSAADRSVLWTETYEREVADVFAVQAEIAQAVAQALRVRIAGADSARLAKGGTRDTIAHELYLRGHAKHMQYTEGSIRAAIALYEQAAARDPNYADAWAAIGVAWSSLGDEYVAPREAGEHMIAAASRALAIDSTLGTARFDRALGLSYLRRISIADLVAEARRAADAAPNDAMVQALGGFVVLLGNRDDGVAIAMRAHDVDPLSTVVSMFPAWVLRYAGRIPEAEREARTSLGLLQDVGIAHGILGIILLDQHRDADALSEFDKGRATGDRDLSTAGLGMALARLGRTDEAKRLRAELEAQARTRYVVGDWVAKLCLALGDRAGALAWLERAADQGSAYTRYVDFDPDFAALRGDPRFEVIRRKAGLPATPSR